MKQTKAQSGFTLAEMAIVVVISGILLTIGAKGFSALLTSNQREATRQKHALLGNALTTYLAANRRLPCPDTGFTGVETRATPNNAATRCVLTSGRVIGRVPYLTLGISRDLAMDAMGNFITYEVQESNTVPTRDWTRSARFSTANVGTLNVRTRPEAAPSTTTNLTTQAVVVLVSHGGNGSGAFNLNGTQNTLPANATSPDERNNVPGAGDPNAGIYFQRPFSDNAVAANGGAFDDIVTFFNPSDLLSPSLLSGGLGDDITLTRRRLERLQQIVIGFAIRNPLAAGGAGCADPLVTAVCHRLAFAAAGVNGISTPNNVAALFPYVNYGVLQADATDPWGNPIRYVIGDVGPPVTPAVSTPAINREYINPGFGTVTGATTNAFTLTSRGPDGVLGTPAAPGDDIILITTRNELLARVR